MSTCSEVASNVLGCCHPCLPQLCGEDSQFYFGQPSYCLISSDFGNGAFWAAGLAERVPGGFELFLRHPLHLRDALQDVRPRALLLLHPPLQPLWLLRGAHLHPGDDPHHGQRDSTRRNVRAPLHPPPKSFQGGQKLYKNCPTLICRWPGIGNPCRTCSSRWSPPSKQSPPSSSSSSSFLASLLFSALRFYFWSCSGNWMIMSSCLGAGS